MRQLFVTCAWGEPVLGPGSVDVRDASAIVGASWTTLRQSRYAPLFRRLTWTPRQPRSPTCGQCWAWMSSTETSQRRWPRSRSALRDGGEGFELPTAQRRRLTGFRVARSVRRLVGGRHSEEQGSPAASFPITLGAAEADVLRLEEGKSGLPESRLSRPTAIGRL